MKKLLALLILSCVFFSCKDTFVKTPVTRKNPNSLSKAGPDPIPLDLAKKMISNYLGRADASNNGKFVLDNTGYTVIRVSLNKLEVVISRLKNDHADGIRLYFATFGDNLIDEESYKVGLEKSYSHQNTIVLTGTKDSLVNGANDLELHYHRDYFNGGNPLAFFPSLSGMSGLRPIPVNLAEKLVKNYEANEQRMTNIPNTGAIWLDINKLDLLINKLKRESADGVSIYFAKYGDNVADEKTFKAGLEDDYSYHNTIILVGSKESVVTNSTGVKTSNHLDSFSTNESNGSAYTFFTDPVNKGELCPPPSPCCSIGATLLCPPSAVN
ncbi:hypothetical protein [Mucilaginibacter sp. AK015]|uniref:hypothetical protein n=1 Tax=Mucilaginibacter sp. AK015 TaxID=2723072 RepID=UPI001613A2AB|nr:hypothetical protein [Mucilaginibacter sp. AK015]MBB5397384.1 hypothetical protein [Mucilaginibacter sp. AK015]